MKLYSSLAYLWPVINPLNEYFGEVVRIRELIDPFVSPLETPSMLEFGCGGGRLLSYFTQEFNTYGVDVSPQMIEQSRVLNPSTTHLLGDMRFVELDMRFDVIFVGDSIGYAVSESDLRLAIENCKKHLKDHGVLVLVPDWTEETYNGSNVWSRTAQTGSSVVSLTEYQYRNGSSPMELRSVFVFLITSDQGTIIEVDYHSFGLHSNAVWKSVIESVGFVLETKAFMDHESGQSQQAFICTIADQIPG